MILADTHCHLDLQEFDADRAAVLERAGEQGVTRILIPSLGIDSSRRVVGLAESDARLYAAIGVHPNEASTWNEGTAGNIASLALHPRVVAIGEIGLDYYWDSAPPELQKCILQEQLVLAAQFNKPVVLHSREKGDLEAGDCTTDLLSILEEWVAGLEPAHPLAGRPGVLHSYSGSLETAREAIRLGFYIGVTGPVTYKNAEARRRIVAALPLESLLLETDAPFLAPHPRRGRRNEPAFIALIADKIAELHSTSREQVARLTTANATRLFGWEG